MTLGIGSLGRGLVGVVLLIRFRKRQLEQAIIWLRFGHLDLGPVFSFPLIIIIIIILNKRCYNIFFSHLLCHDYPR